MAISEKLLELIYLLHDEPLMSFNDMAKKLDVSWVTAKKRYEELFTQKILGKPYATIDYHKLKLIRVNVFAFVKNFTTLTNLENACREHPYTNYRSRIVGREFGLFMVFFIPNNSEAITYLKEFFEILEQKQWLSSFLFMVNHQPGLQAKQDLQYFDFESFSWAFRWDHWFDDFDLYEPEMTSSQSDVVGAIDEFDLNELTYEILIVMRRLTYNPSIRQTDLVRDDKINVSKTEAHRLYNYVMDNLIINIRNSYDLQRFGATDLKLFHVKFDEQIILDKFIQFLRKNAPPFGYSLQILENNEILFWVNNDQKSMQILTFELFKRFPHSQVFDLVRFASNSVSYAFWEENFDLNSKTWKYSKEWMISNPLTNLGLIAEDESPQDTSQTDNEID